jgi:hypothetical protein
MTFNKHIPAVAASIGVLGFFALNASAQEVVVRTPAATATATTTTEYAGTISDFGNDTIVVRGENTAPVTYRYTKTTTYVDDAGAPVSVETVKSGLPVTVHYIRDGDRVVADRVIVHRKKVITTEPAPVLEEKKTTTTTTTTDRK